MDKMRLKNDNYIILLKKFYFGENYFFQESDFANRWRVEGKYEYKRRARAALLRW